MIALFDNLSVQCSDLHRFCVGLIYDNGINVSVVPDLVMWYWLLLLLMLLLLLLSLLLLLRLYPVIPAWTHVNSVATWQYFSQLSIYFCGLRPPLFVVAEGHNI